MAKYEYDPMQALRLRMKMAKYEYPKSKMQVRKAKPNPLNTTTDMSKGRVIMTKPDPDFSSKETLTKEPKLKMYVVAWSNENTEERALHTWMNRFSKYFAVKYHEEGIGNVDSQAKRQLGEQRDIWRERAKKAGKKLAKQNNIIKELEKTIEGWEQADKEQKKKLAKIEEEYNKYKINYACWSCMERIGKILKGDKRG